MTVSEETHQKLQRARDLLRHVVPDGDPAAIVDRALTVLVQQAELRKFAAAEQRRTSRPRVASAGAHSRVVPASIRRAVWSRDQGRCAFEGFEGRCVETGGLEFHHVLPFASGGPTTVENLQLRCRAHNAFEGRQVFGNWRGRTRAPRGVSETDSVRKELVFATQP
jgi:5-methylcytosine-specific restriction endonuclease McrA